MSDLISRQAAVKEVKKLFEMGGCYCDRASIVGMLNSMPSAQPELLTDEEKRIFYAAMGREEKVCKQVDEEWADYRDPHADSLVRVCHEIIRKVRAALWGN